MKQNYKIILIIISIFVLNEISKIISIEGLFYISLFIAIIFYIGYINKSIWELKDKVKLLEEKLENYKE